MKSEGMKAGVPDIVLPVARRGYHSLYIELKVKGGRTTAAQEEWLAMLNKEGNRAVVCEGWEEAKRVIEEYLNEKRT